MQEEEVLDELVLVRQNDLCLASRLELLADHAGAALSHHRLEVGLQRRRLVRAEVPASENCYQ